MTPQNVLLVLISGKAQPCWHKPSQTIYLGICKETSQTNAFLANNQPANQYTFLNFIDGESEVVKWHISAAHVHSALGGQKRGPRAPRTGRELLCEY